MAAKTKEQLETELAAALEKIKTLEADNLQFIQDNEALALRVKELQEAVDSAGSGGDPFTREAHASLAADQLADAQGISEDLIRAKVQAGLTRKQAIEVITAQAAQDAAAA